MTDVTKLSWQYAALAIAVAVIAATPPTIVALSTHKVVNSRMTEMLAVVKSLATAEAILQEQARARERRGAAAEIELDRVLDAMKKGE